MDKERSIHFLQMWGTAVVFFASLIFFTAILYLMFFVDHEALAAVGAVFAIGYVGVLTSVAYHFAGLLAKQLVRIFPGFVEKILSETGLRFMVAGGLILAIVLPVSLLQIGNTIDSRSKANRLAELTTPGTWTTRTVPALSTDLPAFQIRLPKHASIHRSSGSRTAQVVYEGGSSIVTVYNQQLHDPLQFVHDVVKLPAVCTAGISNTLQRDFGPVYSLKIQCPASDIEQRVSFQEGMDNSYRTLGELLFERDGMVVEVAGQRASQDAPAEGLL